MTGLGKQSDQKKYIGQWSIPDIFRDMGPAGLPAIFLFAAIILLWAMGSQVSYSAPNLILALYFIFSLLMPLLIVFLISRSFFIKGEIGLLMLGCGVLIWSIAGVPALVLAKSNPNITFTIYNLCLCMSALCHFIGANVSLWPRYHLRSTGLWLAGAYIGALCCVGFIIYLTLEGWTPAFFVPGQGGTSIRQWVLGSAVVMFILSAALLKAPVRNPSALLNWYALALLLIAAGLIGFMFQSSVDSLLVWASRSALYLSGVYMLIAAIASFRETHAQLYNELSDLALDGIVVHKIVSETLRGNFIRANPAICTMLGYTKEEMHKLTPLDIMIPEDLKSVPAESEILIRDKVLRHTKTLLSKDGRHIPVEINTRLYEDQGRPIALSIIRDVTERKRAEEQLALGNRKMVELLESIQDGFFTIDHDWRFAYVNRLSADNLGFKPEDLVGQNIWQKFPQIIGTDHEVFYRKAMETREIQRFEIHGVMTDKWYNINIYPSVEGISLYWQDVTDRKRAAEAQRESEKKYRELVESANSIIIRWKPDGEITYFNRYGLSFFGYREEEILGRNIMVLAPSRDSSGHDLSGLAHAILEHPEQYITNENENVLSDGRRVWVSWTNKAILDEAGNIREILVIGNDITKRKEAEDALYNAMRLSSALNRINETLHSNLNAREVLQILVNEGAKAIGCESAGLSLLHKNVWTVSVVYGFPESFVGAIMNNDEELHAMLAMRTQRPVVIDDAFNDERVNRDHMRKHNIRSVMVVPLIVRNEPLGALFLNQQTAPKPFSEVQVQFAEQLASTAAIALENSRLFEEHVQALKALRKSEEALSLANESLEQKVRERTMDLQQLTEQLERSHHELRKLASKLVMAEQRERKRIAEVLHDDIAQILAAIRMRLDLLQAMPSDQKDKQVLMEAKAFLLQSIHETRALMNELGNPVLFDLGLKSACEALAGRLMETSPIQIKCDIRDAYKNLKPDMKILLYQVVRELLNNVVKHSQAKTAQVMIGEENDRFKVEVKDDGVGFAPKMPGLPTMEGGYGLYSIRERLMAIDGSLRIDSALEVGTVVTAILPASLD